MTCRAIRYLGSTDAVMFYVLLDAPFNEAPGSINRSLIVSLYAANRERTSSITTEATFCFPCPKMASNLPPDVIQQGYEKPESGQLLPGDTGARRALRRCLFRRYRHDG